MSSNLGCVGLAVSSAEEFEALARTVIPEARELGKSGNRRVLRWEDRSGARLIFRLDGNGILGFVPSFAGAPGATISPPRPINADTWSVDVLDEDGEVATVAAVDLEQGGLTEKVAEPVRASLVALGQQITSHVDEAAFAASDDSLLAPGTDPGEPPEHVRERGWPWPPRVAPESFISFGVFGDPATANAGARLHGVVVNAERRTTDLTGQAFFVVRLRSTAMEVDLCLEASANRGMPMPGQVVGGSVYLVGSLAMDLPARPSLLDRFRARIS